MHYLKKISRFSETDLGQFINIDDDDGEGDVVGRISVQQARVFAMFSVAFVMTGCASVYSHRGVSHLAVLFGAAALGLITAVIQEGRSR